MPAARPITERFWEKVGRAGDDECWPWKASLNNRGYGWLNRNGRMILAHRFSWDLHYGPLADDGMCVLHRCDTPACVNPEHLFLGTNQDNMDDKVAKRRHRFGETVPNRRLTESQAREIIRRRGGGEKLKEIATAMDIPIWLVKDISRGKTWSHLKEGNNV